MPMSPEEIVTNAVRLRDAFEGTDEEAAKVFMSAAMAALYRAHGPHEGTLIFAKTAQAMLDHRRNAVLADGEPNEGDG